MELSQESVRLLKDGRVFCGFSGGADSLFLLLFLKRIQPDYSFTLNAVHFEHGFRGKESEDDAEFCRDFCKKQGIPFFLKRLEVPWNKLRGEGDEEGARRLRLEYWKSLSEQYPDCLIALGHHADDRAENLFLRLFRGSNSSGLSSLKELSVVNGIRFFRPVLEKTKEEIESELRLEGCDWRVDSTNKSDDYGRNFLRRNTLPEIYQKFPFSRKGIQHSISALEEDSDCLNRLAEAEWEQMQGLDNVSPQDWTKIHKALRCRILRILFREKFQMEFIPGRSLMERFHNALEHPTEEGCFIPTGENMVLHVNCRSVSVFRKNPPVPVRWDWKKNSEAEYGDWFFKAEKRESMTGEADCAWFDWNQFPETVWIAAPAPGDRMIPFGKHAPVLLKKLFNDRKISSAEKPIRPVIRNGKEIYWVPGVKNSNLCRVENTTKTVLRIKFSKKNTKST